MMVHRQICLQQGAVLVEEHAENCFVMQHPCAGVLSHDKGFKTLWNVNSFLKAISLYMGSTREHSPTHLIPCISRGATFLCRCNTSVSKEYTRYTQNQDSMELHGHNLCLCVLGAKKINIFCLQFCLKLKIRLKYLSNLQQGTSCTQTQLNTSNLRLKL